MAEVQRCGFCHGTGRVPGRKHDAYGYRPDYPDLVVCEYCGGGGLCEGGGRLLPAGLRATPDAYGDEARRLYGRGGREIG